MQVLRGLKPHRIQLYIFSISSQQQFVSVVVDAVWTDRIFSSNENYHVMLGDPFQKKKNSNHMEGVGMAEISYSR